MSDIDPTPNTPTTVGDRLAWFRGDLGERLASLSAQVAALQGSPPASLATIYNEIVTGLDQLQIDILGLRGAPETTMRDIWAKMSILEGALDQTLPSLKAGVTELNQRLDKIQSVLGAEPYSSSETGNIRALLMSLLSAQGNTGIIPDGTTPDIAASVTATLNGRRYVVWSNAISGVTKAANNIELTASNWSGYSIYVQSAAETCWISADNAEWPTNSWLTAPLTGTIAVSVPSQYAVRAYLRVPAVQITTLNSMTLVEGSGTQEFAIWPEQFPAVVYLGQRTLAQVNLQNYSLRARGGSGSVTVKYRLTTDADTVTREILLGLNSWSVFTYATKLVFFVRSPSAGPFYIDLAPPGVTPPT